MTANALATAARIGAALVLVALLVLGVRPEPTERARFVDHRTTGEALAQAVTSGGTGTLTYLDSIPPDRRTARLLAGAASAGREVALVVPGAPPRLAAYPPADPVAERRTSLLLRVRGAPDEAVRVVIEDGAGQRDSVEVVLGPTGMTATRVAVEPARTGLERWTLSTGRDSVTATAWIRPPEPLRVLVVGSAPSWEARYLVRALEARGVDVTVRQNVGRDLAVVSAGSAVEPTADGLSGFDVVVTSTSGGALGDSVLQQWVRDAGGGLLVLEGGGALPVRSTGLTWSGPAELLPLPALDMDVSGSPLALAAGEVPVVTLGTDRVLVAAAVHGRGRRLRSGLTTWPWVLSGGVPDAHTAWWVSAVDWLAGGLTRDAMVTGAASQPLAAWHGRIDGRVPGALRVTAPDASVDSAAAVLNVEYSASDRGTLSFVPTAAGTYLLRDADPVEAGVGTPLDTAPTLDAALALDGTDRLDWGKAALEIGGSGGTIVSAADAPTSAGTAVGRSGGRPWLPFLLVAGLMGAGWTVRRTRGLA